MYGLSLGLNNCFLILKKYINKKNNLILNVTTYIGR